MKLTWHRSAGVLLGWRGVDWIIEKVKACVRASWARIVRAWKGMNGTSIPKHLRDCPECTGAYESLRDGRLHHAYKDLRHRRALRWVAAVVIFATLAAFAVFVFNQGFAIARVTEQKDVSTRAGVMVATYTSAVALIGSAIVSAVGLLAAGTSWHSVYGAAVTYLLDHGALCPDCTTRVTGAAPEPLRSGTGA